MAPKHGTAPRLCGSEPHVLLLYDSGLIYLYKFGGAGGSRTPDDACITVLQTVATYRQ